MTVTGGSTDVTTMFMLRLAATGVEATGLTITNIDLQYTRTGAAPTAKVDATALAAADSAHSDNTAFEIDATDQPGLYRVDWPDAAFAAGAKQVALTVKVATCFTETLIVDIDPPVNVTKISDDSTAADNCELMFDGTGYAGGTTKLGVDTVAISGDTTAADNCELMFDGTGYAGGTAKLGVDLVAIGGVAQSATDLKDFADTGYDPSTHKVAGVVLADTATAVTNAVVLPTGTGAGQISLSGGGVALQANQDVRNVSGAVAGAVGSVTGDVGGKVLGGGAGTITGTGVRAVDGSGNAIAPATTALSNATWTDAKAGYLDAAITSRSTLTAQNVWEYATRTLSSFGTLIADVWSYATRVLTAATNLSIPSAADAAAAVWGAVTRSLTDKAGFTLHSDYDAAKTAAPANTALSTAVWTNAKAAFLDQAISAAKTLTEAYDAAKSAASQTSVNTVAGYIDTEVAAIKLKTDNLPASPAASGDIPSAATIAAAVGTRAPAAESYAADGSIPTFDQFLFMILSALTQFDITGTTLTTRKLNGTTAAMTYTLDSATEPTSRTRAS